MRNNKRSIMLMLLSLTPVVSIAQPNESFFQKIESIKKDLYKIHTHELCALLNIPNESPNTITADQLKQKMSSNSDMLVINVLTEKYYKDCHIAGSINVPLPALVEHAASWNQSQRIVVYCALDECDAGEKAAILLAQMGFTDVADYKGGIKEWFQLGYPTQGPALSDYLHATVLASSHKGYELYPETIVCSNQTRWISRYQK
jgi:rhodanese-related sulfurtransferase